MRTEDEVRDSAKLILGFDKKEKGIAQGAGQITTFNQLGFKGSLSKPLSSVLPRIPKIALMISLKGKPYYV